MKVDNNSHNTLPPVQTTGAKKTVSADKPAQAINKTPELTIGSTSSVDMDRMNRIVKDLMAQSDVRPEVVKGRRAEDPVKAFDEDKLREFVKALRQQDDE